MAERRLHILPVTIFLVSLSAPFAASGACQKQVLSGTLEGFASAVFGPDCVRDFDYSKRLCAPDGNKVDNPEISVVDNNNALTRTGAEIAGDGACAIFTLTVRTRDHTGTSPGYRCSPGYARARISAEYCLP